MSINTTFLEYLNNKDSRIKKISHKMIKFFSRKPDVIQIGVGGFSSSGKTVLIDALFSFFDNKHIPGYIPPNFTGGFFKEETNPFEGVYTDYYSLRLNVSSSFHKPDNATLDDGTWNAHTHHIYLSFCGKKKLILIRNLPGEMFRIYFEQQPNAFNKSLKILFDEFIKSSNKYRNVYRSLFKDASQHTQHDIEKKMTEIRDAFANKLQSLNMKAGSDIEEVKTNFFGFLFYVTSDFNVYCIKSKGRRGENDDDSDKSNKEIKNIYHGIESDKGERFIICITQFDRILKTNNELPKSEVDNPKSTSINIVQKVKKSLLETIGDKKRKEPSDKNNNNELAKYWLSMNALYRDIEQKETKLIKEEEWKKLNDLIGETRYNLFTTSVAYNFSASKFFKFRDQDAEGSQTSGDVWKEELNGRRTPVGVLELVLYILKKSGFDLKKSGLPLPQMIEYDAVIRKINGKN